MIYVATVGDLPEIIKLSLNIPAEHGFDNLPKVDISKVSTFFYKRFNDAPIFVYKEDDKIIGFVGVQIEEFWWSKECVVNDYIFYVDPEYRSLKVFNSLLGALKDFGKLNKLPVISYFMSNNRTEAKEKLFKRQGFKKAGFIASHGI